MAYRRTDFKSLLKQDRKQNKPHKQYIYADKLQEWQSTLQQFTNSKKRFVIALMVLLGSIEPVLWWSLKWHNRNYKEGREYNSEVLAEYMDRLFNHAKIEKNKFVALLQDIICQQYLNLDSSVRGFID